MVGQRYFQVQNQCSWDITVKVLYTKCIQGIDDTFDVRIPTGGAQPPGQERLLVIANSTGHCGLEASHLNIGYSRGEEFVQAKISENNYEFSWEITDHRYIRIEDSGDEMFVICTDSVDSESL